MHNTNNYTGHTPVSPSLPNTTAILVFSRNAEEEAANKNYIQSFGKKKGIAIAAKLISKTLCETSKTELPVFKFFSNKQKGKNFGERLTDAIEQVFAMGFHKIIVTGTDAPAVNSGQFRHVAKKLAGSDLVIAPSKDGGVTIIGIKRAAYNKQTFLKIAWHTSEVFEQLKNYAAFHQYTISTLVSAPDVDNVAGVYKWFKTNHQHWFSLFLESILRLSPRAKWFMSRIQLCSPLALNTYELRGPPRRFSL